MELPDYDALSRRLHGEQAAEHARQRYWLRTRRLTLGLLLVWAGVSFGLVYFSRQLSFNFFGWPFGFWVASQGALLVFCVINAYYAWAMRRHDAEHGQQGVRAPETPR